MVIYPKTPEEEREHLIKFWDYELEENQKVLWFRFKDIPSPYCKGDTLGVVCTCTIRDDSGRELMLLSPNIFDEKGLVGTLSAEDGKPVFIREKNRQEDSN